MTRLSHPTQSSIGNRSMHLTLNAFRLNVDASTVRCYVRRDVAPASVRTLREQYRDQWFVYFRDGVLYLLDKDGQSASPGGESVELGAESHEALSLLAARVNDVAPSIFPEYDALRHRPFTFEGRKQELLSAATENARIQHPLLGQFTIRPKIAIDCRLLEPVDGDLHLILVLSVDTRWAIDAGLHELVSAGIPLDGLYAIRRDPDEGERRLVGRIREVRDDGQVTFSESFDDLVTLSAHEIALEGSRANFAHCLKRLLGPQYKRLEDARVEEEANLLKGPAQQEFLERLAEFVRKKQPIQLSQGITVSLGDRVEFHEEGAQPSAWAGTPEQYCFDAAKSKRHKYAWPGLERYGPFDRETFSRKSPRILVLCPNTAQGSTEQFIKNLKDGIQSVRHSKYAQGFARIFGLHRPTFEILPVPVAQRSDQIYAQYRATVEQHLAKTCDYELAIVIIDDRYSDTPDEINPYLHTKALLMVSGIPVQEIRQSTTARDAKGLQYVLQNFTLAMYAKMGGTPWTVAHDQTVTDEIVMGLGSCELSGSRFEERQRYVGITTVFRGDGNYLLSNVSKACPFAEYGDVLRTSTRSVLSEVKTRNGWQPGDRVRLVMHSFKPLKMVEVAEIAADTVNEVANEQTVEFAFLNVVADHPFKLIDSCQSGIETRRGTRKAEYVPQRGVSAQLGQFTRLLALNGPTLVKRDVSPLPSPTLLHLHASSTYVDQAYLTEQALKFSALSWRSTLPAREPVTVYYSRLIAGLLSRLQHVPEWSPAVLNTKLRASRWFL